MAAKAARFLGEGHDLLLTDLVVAEVVYVLESFYGVARPRVAELVRMILTFPAISVVDQELLLRATEVYEMERVDFADAYLVACAERAGDAVIASFDRSLDRVATVTRVEPGRTSR